MQTTDISSPFSDLHHSLKWLKYNCAQKEWETLCGTSRRSLKKVQHYDNPTKYNIINDETRKILQILKWVPNCKGSINTRRSAVSFCLNAAKTLLRTSRCNLLIATIHSVSDPITQTFTGHIRHQDWKHEKRAYKLIAKLLKYYKTLVLRQGITHHFSTNFNIFSIPGDFLFASYASNSYCCMRILIRSFPITFLCNTFEMESESTKLLNYRSLCLVHTVPDDSNQWHFRDGHGVLVDRELRTYIL